ncbi:11526_t:CDS:2, partial [Funneliformis mosseae]
RKIINNENCPPETRLRPRQEVEPSGIRQNCLPKENQMEEKNRNSSFAYPTFSTYCTHGKVRLLRLVKPPPYLLNLYTSSNSDAISFRKNIRCYNNVLAYTSFGTNINTIPEQGISDFRIHGQVYHRIGLLLPEEGSQPAFAQLYIYNSVHENAYRHNVMVDLDNTILQNLLTVMDKCNP